MSKEQIIVDGYHPFNKRDIESVLAFFDPEVEWPNGWEGVYVHRHDEVRDYWTRQWAEINPRVEPLGFKTLVDDRLKVTVHQYVENKNGAVLFANIFHTYPLKTG